MYRLIEKKLNEGLQDFHQENILLIYNYLIIRFWIYHLKM